MTAVAVTTPTTTLAFANERERVRLLVAPAVVVFVAVFVLFSVMAVRNALASPYYCCDCGKVARAGAENISAALEIYKLNVGRYPTNGEGLNVLVVPAQHVKPIIDYPWQLNDQWGHRFKYTIPGVHNPTKFDVASAGPDGYFGSDDDLGNWSDE